MKVPFLELETQRRSIKKEIDAAIERTLQGGIFIGGHEVEQFEKQFARYNGSRYCISLNSGTDALILGTRALNLSPQDEIIFSVNTYYATALAAVCNSLKPVFADTNDTDSGISLNDLKKKITSRTKAVFLTHLYGQPDKIDEVQEIIRKTRRKIYLVEDCAQAHGALYKNKKVGTFGIFSAFSFYPSKNLGAYGDGGAVLTDDARLNRRIRQLKEYGQTTKNRHESIGVNSRLDTLQAAVLQVKLKKIDAWNKLRRQNAQSYDRLLKEVLQIQTPADYSERKSVYHVYAIRAKKRNNLQNYLSSRGIGTQIHYPFPLHEQKAFAYLKYKKSDFPVAAERAKQMLSLPMYPELTGAQIKYVTTAIRRFFDT